MSLILAFYHYDSSVLMDKDNHDLFCVSIQWLLDNFLH